MRIAPMFRASSLISLRRKARLFAARFVPARATGNQGQCCPKNETSARWTTRALVRSFLRRGSIHRFLDAKTCRLGGCAGQAPAVFFQALEAKWSALADGKSSRDPHPYPPKIF